MNQKVVYSPEEAVRKFEKMCEEDDYDTEITHRKADIFLCEVLTQLGYGELVERYEKLGKWYS